MHIQKKLLTALVALALILSPLCALAAEPRFQFSSDLYVGFIGREVTLTIELKNPSSLSAKTSFDLRDEAGNTVASYDFSRSTTKRRMKIVLPAEWQPRQEVALWLGDTRVSEPTVVAVDDLNNKALKSVQVDDKRMSISFDCAYGDWQTDKILDKLDEYGVKTTFFMTGEWAKNFPEHVRDIVAHGHEVANHSYNHPHMLTRTYNSISWQIEETNRLIYEACGVYPKLFRPPYGECNHFTRAIARMHGCELVMWTISSTDSRSETTGEIIVKRVTTKATPGCIILMHNGGHNTMKALDEVLTYYRDNGFTLVPVSELMNKGDYGINEDGVQYAK